MSGINRILVPADFTSCSKEALRYAVELAERYFGAAIDVLHVWESPLETGSQAPVLVTSSSHTEQAARLQVLQGLEALLAEHEAKGVVAFKRLHESGKPVDTIIEVARRGRYDLIIMGTHGRCGMAHDYAGSVAERVVRQAPCPVLTIREKHLEPPVASATGGVAAGHQRTDPSRN